MELRQLEYFRTIADAGSISEAARILHMSQPPLSTSMKQLEEEMGNVLFERGRKITLTEAGKILYERAGILLSLSKNTIREVSATKNHALLKIGVTPTTLPVILPYLAEFRKAEENYDFEIYDGTTFRLHTLLEDKVIDCAVVRTPTRLNHVNAIVLGTDMMYIASKEKRKEKELALKELAGLDLILYRRYSDFILNEMKKHQLNPHISVTCDDGRTALDFVRSGMGCAVIPYSLHSACCDLYLTKINDTGLQTKILFIYRKEKETDPSIEKFVSCLPQKSAGSD